MKNILIIGATSAIAEAAARIWATQGDRLFLVARNQERLNVLMSDLRIRGAHEVCGYCIDLNNIHEHAEMFNAVFIKFSTINIALIAHGTLSNQKACEASVDLTLNEIKTNALSVIALLTTMANYFERQKHGAIAIISSVAGDRGRASNYVYGSGKALVSSFASGLRQRLHKANVAVVTIKPGFVDTPMTASLKKGILWAKPNSVARGIVKAIDQRTSIVYLPAFWRVVMMIVVSIPEFIYKKLQKL